MGNYKKIVENFFKRKFEFEGEKVDPYIKQCFQYSLANIIDINFYFLDFCKRQKIPFNYLNKIGHQFSLNPYQNNTNSNQFSENKDKNCVDYPFESNQYRNNTPPCNYFLYFFLCEFNIVYF